MWILAATLAFGAVVVALSGCADFARDDQGDAGPGTTTTTDGQDDGDGDGDGDNNDTSGASDSTSGRGLPDGPTVELVTNEGYFDRARLLMGTATSRLDVIQFETNPGYAVDLLVAEVVAATKRGVAVRMLLDDEIEDNDVLRKELLAAGVSVALDSSKRRTHAKIIYADDAFLVGSTNWSDASIQKNNETNVLVRDKSAREAMGKWIDALWADSSKSIPTKLSTSKIAALYTDGGFEAAAGKLIDKATSHIEVVTYGIHIDDNYDDSPVQALVDKLGKAVERGVEVRFVADRTTSDWGKMTWEFSQASAKKMTPLGIKVRYDPASVVTHAKFLVADDGAIVGTNNWGFGGFELYHEAGVRTYEANVIEGLLTYFEALWDASSP